MNKKLFIIIGIILVALLILLAGYYFLMQNSSTESGGGLAIFKNFFPFGGSEPAQPVEVTVGENPPISTSTPSIDFQKKLRKLSSEPVAGAGTMDFKAGSVVRYIEKATGHIYEVELFSPIKNRLSNTTMPMVYDATWSADTNSLITRYLETDNQTIDTYALTLKTSTLTSKQASTTVATTSPIMSTVSGVQFASNIPEYSVFGTNFFFLQNSSVGTQGIISNFDGSKKKQVWSSALKEVSSQYVNSATVAITTKPYQNISGFLYFINTNNGQMKKILGDISGLSTLVNPDATAVLALSQASGANLYLYTLSTKTSSPLTPVTFPEKCVWSKKDKNIVYCAVPQQTITGSSLTSWYMGFASYTDDIWKFDLKNNTSVIVENLSNDSGENIDVIKPILSTNEQYLVFINKQDGSLWSLDLTK